MTKYVAKESTVLDRSSVSLTRGGVAHPLDASNLQEVFLEDGDVIELKLKEEILEGDSTRWKGSRVLSTVGGFYEVIPNKAKRGATKGETLQSNSYLFHWLRRIGSPFGSDKVFEFVDFSSVIIQRPGENGMREIKVDVSKIANELMSGGKPNPEFTAVDQDVKLKDGDLIILVPREEGLTIGQATQPQPGSLQPFLEAAEEERLRWFKSENEIK